MVATKMGWTKRCLALVMCVGVIGCSSGGSGGPITINKTDLEKNLMKIPSLYSAYKQANERRAPESMAALKKWAKGQSKLLKQYNITNVDDIFTSPRDHEMYLLYHPPKMPMGPIGVLAFEKTGVEGKHMAVSEMANVSTIDDQAAADLSKHAK